jgi:hypothetical protein
LARILHELMAGNTCHIRVNCERRCVNFVYLNSTLPLAVALFHSIHEHSPKRHHDHHVALYRLGRLWRCWLCTCYPDSAGQIEMLGAPISLHTSAVLIYVRLPDPGDQTEEQNWGTNGVERRQWSRTNTSTVNSNQTDLYVIEHLRYHQCHTWVRRCRASLGY